MITVSISGIVNDVISAGPVNPQVTLHVYADPSAGANYSPFITFGSGGDTVSLGLRDEQNPDNHSIVDAELKIPRLSINPSIPVHPGQSVAKLPGGTVLGAAYQGLGNQIDGLGGQPHQPTPASASSSVSGSALDLSGLHAVANPLSSVAAPSSSAHGASTEQSPSAGAVAFADNTVIALTNISHH